MVQTYARPPDVVLERGEGARLWDASGKEYLDFYGGIAVNSIGHSHPHWVEAVRKAAGELQHVSNLFLTRPQVELAKRLVESSKFADRAFFANSGTEANEAAIKFARKFAKVRAGVDPYDADAVREGAPGSGPGAGRGRYATEIVSFKGSFHGRTYGALSLTYKDRYKTPFAPLVPDTAMAPYGDFAAAERLIQPGRTAAVFVEPVQGEGGVLLPPAGFLAHLRALCDEAGALLVYDEVQVGLGRLGSLYAHEGPVALDPVSGEHVFPDLLTLAKPLAGGLPIGAMLATERVAEVMTPGDHGSTFAGGPLVCTAALAALDILESEDTLRNVRDLGVRLKSKLREALAFSTHVKAVRGLGLLVGIELDVQATPVVDAARRKGLLVITAGAGNVIRLAPPLVINEADVDQAVDILAEALKEAL